MGTLAKGTGKVPMVNVPDRADSEVTSHDWVRQYRHHHLRGLLPLAKVRPSYLESRWKPVPLKVYLSRAITVVLSG
jgi:hypothetical protein